MFITCAEIVFGCTIDSLVFRRHSGNRTRRSSRATTKESTLSTSTGVRAAECVSGVTGRELCACVSEREALVQGRE
eukprot:3449363-Pleurochrysis_carterae.AAC.2